MLRTTVLQNFAFLSLLSNRKEVIYLRVLDSKSMSFFSGFQCFSSCPVLSNAKMLWRNHGATGGSTPITTTNLNFQFNNESITVIGRYLSIRPTLICELETALGVGISCRHVLSEVLKWRCECLGNCRQITERTLINDECRLSENVHFAGHWV